MHIHEVPFHPPEVPNDHPFHEFKHLSHHPPPFPWVVVLLHGAQVRFMSVILPYDHLIYEEV